MDVAVIGLGLIGGSVLRALASAGHRVLGYDADPATRATARTAAAQAPVDGRWQVARTVRDAVARVELVVVAVPLPAVAGVLDELAGAGYTGLVTDVTSIKGPVQTLVDRHLHAGSDRLAGFVGGHPMAGRETSGFGAADPDLFAGCAWVLCLEPGSTSLADWLELAALITGLNARVVPAVADEHDRAVAAVSHVPHLLASALAAVAADDPLAGTLGAGSFRDGTRVAATRPDLVAAMCGGNAAAVGPALDAVLDALTRARAALDTADPIDALRTWLRPGSAARLAWPPRGGTPVELPAEPEALLRLGRAGGWLTRVADDRRTVTAVRPARHDPA
ncbi:prephenate dehydrogenase/arogenate dehydrogenase family protein [Plantactinospora sp. S1510]|uniref:Prephenate dehydrogenase/arogenate dehydrogenase family protein n=1 Tax=Plantactinospora alkalitolerans TaxID=2789879 RepID=A0ABS0GWS3_9ACTN|nr:prephenate dehydrogenase/arogenate dehydrogenase family protein [Plantactinospora alkalitolerans]MBF9130637.1 prephenate dehydrogenase/arogenate dehydrogenase family protein [Plantactinospora alkalitolerans]